MPLNGNAAHGHLYWGLPEFRFQAAAGAKLQRADFQTADLVLTLWRRGIREHGKKSGADIPDRGEVYQRNGA